MLAFLTARRRALLNGFWFVPGAVALAFAALALGLIATDRALGAGSTGFLFDGDAGAARAILQTIAGSLITVAGLSFSLTVVILVLVSGQFTPRSVPAFLSDRVTQTTAGAFVGVFAYCLLVLRTVRDEEADASGFVPGLSVTVALGLAIVTLGLLLLFIHHLGTSIQASSIVSRIGRETLNRIEQLYPAELDEREAVAPERAEDEALTVYALRPGYVRAIALDDLVVDLPPGCARLHVHVATGDFVTKEDVLAEIWPATARDEGVRAVRRAISIGDERDTREDVLFGIRQLAEIATKALSPGINDPTTAVTAIGYLRATLELLAQRPFPPGTRRDERTRITVIATQRAFDEYVRGAFDEIGRYATGNASVVVALLDAIDRIGTAARRSGYRERLSVLARTAEAVAIPALADARTERDRILIDAALTQAQAPTAES